MSVGNPYGSRVDHPASSTDSIRFAAIVSSSYSVSSSPSIDLRPRSAGPAPEAPPAPTCLAIESQANMHMHQAQRHKRLDQLPLDAQKSMAAYVSRRTTWVSPSTRDFLRSRTEHSIGIVGSFICDVMVVFATPSYRRG
jgi:hypothetical protein